MDRHWLLTWTMYGNWLPGDRRGFVSNVASANGAGVRHNTPGTPYDADMRELRSFAAAGLVHEQVRLRKPEAEELLSQFRETAAYRGWRLRAAAVMTNHVHLVVGVNGDPDPETLLRDFKSYGSRRLNRAFSRRNRWWTQSGSKRKLPDVWAVAAAVEYVRKQDFPLAVWVDPDGHLDRTGQPQQPHRTPEQPADAGRSPQRTPEQPVDAGRSPGQPQQPVDAGRSPGQPQQPVDAGRSP